MNRTLLSTLSIAVVVSFAGIGPSAFADHETQSEECKEGSITTITVWNEPQDGDVHGQATCPDWTNAYCGPEDDGICSGESEGTAGTTGDLHCTKYQGDHADCGTTYGGPGEGCTSPIETDTQCPASSSVEEFGHWVTTEGILYSWTYLPPIGDAVKCVEGHCSEVPQECGPLFCVV